MLKWNLNQSYVRKRSPPTWFYYVFHLTVIYVTLKTRLKAGVRLNCNDSKTCFIFSESLVCPICTNLMKSSMSVCIKSLFLFFKFRVHSGSYGVFQLLMVDGDLINTPGMQTMHIGETTNVPQASWKAFWPARQCADVQADLVIPCPLIVCGKCRLRQ